MLLRLHGKQKQHLSIFRFLSPSIHSNFLSNFLSLYLSIFLSLNFLFLSILMSFLFSSLRKPLWCLNSYFSVFQFYLSKYSILYFFFSTNDTQDITIFRVRILDPTPKVILLFTIRLNQPIIRWHQYKPLVIVDQAGSPAK